MEIGATLNLGVLTISTKFSSADYFSLHDVILSVQGALGFETGKNRLKDIFYFITNKKISALLKNAYNVMDTEQIIRYMRRQLFMITSDGELLKLDINNVQQLKDKDQTFFVKEDVVITALTGALIASVGYEACRLITLQLLLNINEIKEDDIEEYTANMLPMYEQYYNKCGPAIRDSLLIKEMVENSIKILKELNIDDHWTGEDDCEHETWYVPSLVEALIKMSTIKTNSIYLVRIICSFIVVGFAVRIEVIYENGDTRVYPRNISQGARVIYDFKSGTTSLNTNNFARDGYSYTVTDSLDMSLYAENIDMMRRKTVTIHHTSKVAEQSLYDAWDAGYKIGMKSKLYIKIENNKQIRYKWEMASNNGKAHEGEKSDITIRIRNALDWWTNLDENNATYIIKNINFTEDDLKEVEDKLRQYRDNEKAFISEKHLGAGFQKLRMWLYGLVLSISVKMQSLGNEKERNIIETKELVCPWGRPYSNTTRRLLHSIRILSVEGMHMGQALKFVSFCSAGDTIKPNVASLDSSECIAYWNGKEMCNIGLLLQPTVDINKAFRIYIMSCPIVTLPINVLGEVIAADKVPKADIFGDEKAELVKLQNGMSDTQFSCVVRPFYGMYPIQERVVYEIRCKGRLVRRLSIFDAIESLVRQESIICTCNNRAITNNDLVAYKLTFSDLLNIKHKVEKKYDRPYIVYVHGNDQQRAVATALCSEYEVVTAIKCLVCSFNVLEERQKRMPADKIVRILVL